MNGIHDINILLQQRQNFQVWNDWYQKLIYYLYGCALIWCIIIVVIIIGIFMGIIFILNYTFRLPVAK